MKYYTFIFEHLLEGVFFIWQVRSAIQVTGVKMVLRLMGFSGGLSASYPAEGQMLPAHGVFWWGVIALLLGSTSNGALRLGVE